jgi:tetratricopeptide (TPR) repeat protein
MKTEQRGESYHTHQIKGTRLNTEMPTKLSRYCEGIMEAAWVAAIIVVPVFFNIYSSRIFEPDKITLLRTLALVALGAWVVKLVDEGSARWEQIGKSESFLKTLLKVPLIAPAVALATVYLVSNIFSVTPRISLFGSYQRLQGTYSTLSYIMIFAVMVGNLRKRSQVERIITTAVLVSLPISLYGVLQKWEIDPVPWGGNVSKRIASNMGNSIFVAAYLIMAVPLTIGRIIQSFTSILKDEKRLGSQIIRATLYVFIFLLQLLAIYLSGSRGPLLGLLAGLFFMFVLLSLHWRKRWLTVTTIGAAAAVGLFLIVLSIPNGPLESLRDLPWIGRFGQVFNTEERTSRVRILIWGGASKLVSPHAPLNYPDGTTDRFNFLRPLIGYGPEGMYVAYNQFYPTELGQVEKRNASPDRSHNETWDSLVITGAVGLLAYLWVFGSVFYFGLKWLGLINSNRQRWVFLAIFLLGGLVGAVGMILWQGIEFFGVGLPFGMILGAIGYLTVFALFASSSFETQKKNPNALIMIALLAAIVAHFAEINFGIAIAATRTYFWAYTALLVVIGFILPRSDQVVDDTQQEANVNDPSIENKQQKRTSLGRRRKVEHGKLSTLRRQAPWTRNAILGGVIVGLILTTLGYDFISNSNRSLSTFKIIVDSVTRLPNKDNAVSFGVLALILTIWISGVLVFTAENADLGDYKAWWKAFGITLGVSGGVALLFWLIHAGNLVSLMSFSAANQDDLIKQTGNLGGLLTTYYIYLFIILFGLAAFLPEEWPARSRRSSTAGSVLASVALVVVLVLAYFTNLRVIHADMAFKMAEPFTKNNSWSIATLIYKHALTLAPNEDQYYLFLGRSYLEQAKDVEKADEQEQLVKQAEADLKVAQKINPLNTDHTANLGRLFSWWAGRATDQETRKERGQISSDYYQTATKLSPNNPTLWGEWAILLMDIMQQRDLAFEKLTHAIELDNEYNFTQGLMGDYYMRIAQSASDSQAKTDALDQAIIHYDDAAKLTTGNNNPTKANYMVSEGNAYIQISGLDQQNIDKESLQKAIDAYLQAIAIGPRAADLYKIEETTAKLYVQMGDKSNALAHAKAALDAAPDDQKDRLQTIIDQIQALP